MAQSYSPRSEPTRAATGAAGQPRTLPAPDSPVSFRASLLLARTVAAPARLAASYPTTRPKTSPFAPVARRALRSRGGVHDSLSITGDNARGLRDRRVRDDRRVHAGGA